MLIIPAIDLLGNKVVRLRMGKESTAHVYSDDPLETALHFEKSGAQWIHIVDLDGAFGRPAINDQTIKKIVQKISIPVELGGGIRSQKRIDYWLNHGIGRIVLGSVAVENQELVNFALKQHGNESIVIGIDIQDGRVAIHGWQEESVVEYLDCAKTMQDIGINRLIVTEISTDGMLSGPQLEAMINIVKNTDLKVIASGGISSLQDLKSIARYTKLGIEGVIIGRAIYENKFTVKEAVEQFQ